MYFNITDKAFDSKRLDIMNWVNHEMSLQKSNKTLNNYMRQIFQNDIEMIIVLDIIKVDAFVPYYVIKLNNRMYSIRGVFLGHEYVPLSPSTHVSRL